MSTFLTDIELHITPHMFRHTFATSLLEADVDIHYIQKMPGDSSINNTDIYPCCTVQTDEYSGNEPSQKRVPYLKQSYHIKSIIKYRI